jgi:hypothetical protein
MAKQRGTRKKDSKADATEGLPPLNLHAAGIDVGSAEHYVAVPSDRLMVEHGPIRYRDENESEYVAGFVPTEKRLYSYQDGASILDEWFTTHPDERALREKLTISGLSFAIKAEKRAELARKLAEIADVRVETELKIGRIIPPSERPGKRRDGNENHE